MYRKPKKDDHVTIRQSHPLYKHQSGFILAKKAHLTPNGELQNFFDVGLTDKRHNVHSVITVNERYIGLVLD